MISKSTKQLKDNNLYFYERVTVKNIQKHTYMLDRIILCNVVHGSALVEINGKAFRIDRNSLLFLPPNSRISLLENSEDLEVIAIGFIMAVQEIIFQKLGHNFFVYVFRKLVWEISDEGKKVIDAFCQVYSYLCKMPVDPYSSDIASSLFNAFLLSFYQNVKDRFVTETATNSLNSRTLTTRFAYLLREHYKQHHNVSFYADKLCISSKYLTQIIKNNIGMTPKLAIDRSLGMEALFLLGNTAYNIQEISILLGFPDQSYFGRFFKRLFGISPLAYRQNPDMTLLEKIRQDNKAIDSVNEEGAHIAPPMSDVDYSESPNSEEM